MGKGTIISGGEKGQYTINIEYNLTAYNRQITVLNQEITDLQTKYDNAPDSTAEEKIAKSILKLQITALKKYKNNLQAAYSINTERTVWCADLTEDLSGEVGTIEVPGESTHMQIQPGYNNNAKYDPIRDGQLQLSYNMDYAGFFYNLAMLPGWQKWKPLFRYGTIIAINNDLADITLEDIKSSQQAISINQTSILTGVEFEYMTCDGAAFSEGDEVLIKFEGQDWTKPKIVGFKDNPKPCGGFLYIEKRQESCFFWDLETNDYAKNVKDNNGQIIENWPVEIDSITNFKSKLTAIGTDAIQQDYIYLDPMNYIEEEHDDDPEAFFPYTRYYQFSRSVEVYDSDGNKGTLSDLRNGQERVIKEGNWFGSEETNYHICGARDIWLKLTSLSNINDIRGFLINYVGSASWTHYINLNHNGTTTNKYTGVYNFKSPFLNGEDITFNVSLDTVTNVVGGEGTTTGTEESLGARNIHLKSLLLNNENPYMIVVHQDARVMTIGLPGVSQGDYLEYEEVPITQWNVFSKKATDPMNLNPFELPRNNALETVIEDFIGDNTSWDMKFFTIK